MSQSNFSWEVLEASPILGPLWRQMRSLLLRGWYRQEGVRRYLADNGFNPKTVDTVIHEAVKAGKLERQGAYFPVHCPDCRWPRDNRIIRLAQ